MVAHRSANYRCKAFIYLTCLGAISCTDDQQTIVELHNADPRELTDILDTQLNNDIEYRITDQTIVFYSNKTQLAPTIALLESLDKPTQMYRLSFSWNKPKRYSTTQLPAAITLESKQKNVITLFKKQWKIEIKATTQQQVLLSMTHQNNQENETTLHTVMGINKAQEINHSQLPEGLAVTVEPL